MDANSLPDDFVRTARPIDGDGDGVARSDSGVGAGALPRTGAEDRGLALFGSLLLVLGVGVLVLRRRAALTRPDRGHGAGSRPAP